MSRVCVSQRKKILAICRRWAVRRSSLIGMAAMTTLSLLLRIIHMGHFRPVATTKRLGRVAQLVERSLSIPLYAKGPGFDSQLVQPLRQWSSG